MRQKFWKSEEKGLKHNFNIITDKGIQNNVATPCYIVSEAVLRKNLEILRRVKDRTGCKILLAQKAFSMYCYYPLIGRYIDGVTASGLYEARLGHEELCENEMRDISGAAKRCENHVFSPAYISAHMAELLEICDHIVFNSFAQWKKYRGAALAKGKECGIRINPERSTQEHAIYDPCAPGSRLGVTIADFEENELCGLSGLHFHCLCEQNADALEQTLEAVEEKFGKYIYNMKWINFGGGHHITREDYDVERLVRLIEHVQNKYNVTVYLEPGEAVALNAGFLVSQVLEVNRAGKAYRPKDASFIPLRGSHAALADLCIEKSDMNIAILDTSAACHMPDVIEMPYRPPICGSGEAGEKPYTYSLGGPTCLAGDIIGDYSFDHELKEGDRLIFGDMAIYSMVKNNTFNGMPLPDIAALDESGNVEIVKRFGYEDFKRRL